MVWINDRKMEGLQKGESSNLKIIPGGRGGYLVVVFVVSNCQLGKINWGCVENVFMEVLKDKKR